MMRSVASYRKTALTAYQEVEDGLVAVRRLGEEQAADAAAAKSAQSAAYHADERYAAGVADYIEVTTTHTAALSAQSAALATQAARLNAAVALVQALGGGWTTRCAYEFADAVMDTALKRVCMRDRIRDVLVARILDGTYPAGLQLKELSLAREFNVSQAPVPRGPARAGRHRPGHLRALPRHAGARRGLGGNARVLRTAPDDGGPLHRARPAAEPGNGSRSCRPASRT